MVVGSVRLLFCIFQRYISLIVTRALKTYTALAHSAARCVAVLEIFQERLLPQSQDKENGNDERADTNTVTVAQQGPENYVNS